VISGQLDAKRAGESLVAIPSWLRDLKHGEHLVGDFVRARRAVLRQRVADDASPAELAFRVLEFERHGLAPT
jgi:hypothetical protein